MFKSFSRRYFIIYFRNFVLVVNVAAFIFGILVLFPNLYLFIIARFFQGMCVGLYSAVIPVLIK